MKTSNKFAIAAVVALSVAGSALAAEHAAAEEMENCVGLSKENPTEVKAVAKGTCVKDGGTVTDAAPTAHAAH